MQVGLHALPTFRYYRVAIADPVEAVAATKKLVSKLPLVTVRHVTPLTPEQMVDLKPGDVRPM